MNMYTVPLSSDLEHAVLNKSSISRSSYHASVKAYIHIHTYIYGFFSSWPQNKLFNNILLCIWERSLINGPSEHVYCSLSASLNMKCLINHQCQEVGIMPQ